MKTFLSFLLGFWFFCVSAPFAAAQSVPVKAVKPLLYPKHLTALSPALRKTFQLVAARTYSNIFIRRAYLPAPATTAATRKHSDIIPPKITLQDKIQEKAAIVNLSETNLTKEEVLKTYDNFFKAGVDKPRLLLNALPHLNIQRGYPIHLKQHLNALEYYRRALTTALQTPNTKAPAKRAVMIDAWARKMAAVSNLGFYGVETDADLIVRTALGVPHELVPATDLIAARALLQLQAYPALELLAAKRVTKGTLRLHWKGISEYLKKHHPSVKLPAVSSVRASAPVTQELKKSLQNWNALNAFHTDASAQGTEMWLTLLQSKGQTLQDNSLQQSALAANATPNGPPLSQQRAAPSAGQKESAAQNNARNFSSSKKEPQEAIKALQQFFSTQQIPYQGKTLNELISAVTADPALREQFVTQISRNAADLASLLIKGLGADDIIKLQQVYPPENPDEVFNPKIGKEILNLLDLYARPETNALVHGLLNKNYFFIGHLRGKSIVTGTEFNTSEIADLFQYILEFNQANNIGKTDYLQTFPLSSGKMEQPAEQSNITIEPDRVFTFHGHNEELHWADLPEFLSTFPNAQLKTILYRSIKTGIYYNPKTGQNIVKPDEKQLHNITFDENLKQLADVLKGNQTRAVFLLKEPTAEQNYQFIYDRLQELKPLAERYLRAQIGEKYHIQFFHRFGTHELSGSGNLIPMSNMHVHLEAYIPELQFIFNISVPLRISAEAKEEMSVLFTKWQAEGSPQDSPLDYYGKPSLLRQTLNKLAPIPVSVPPSAQYAPAAEAPEMYEGELVPAFAF